jgi:TonB-dependent SusC/RagA subfamily outer membrane receptor
MKKGFTSKFWKLMKICAIQFMMATIFYCVAIAHSNYAQLLDSEISMQLKDVPFDVALKEIEAVAKVKFFYSTDQLSSEENVSIKAVKQPLKNVLHELLSPRNIKFKVHEKESTITLKKQKDESEKDQSFLEQEPIDNKQSMEVIKITGVVTDESNQQPMAGVNIIVKGTTNGTSTDSEGKFTINADASDILVFSYIGYAHREVNVNSQSVMSVVLSEEIKSLNEVSINAGYYTTSKVTQTGNIGKIESKDIAKQPISNPLAALQARVPGLEIIQSTGVPGGNFKVRIRGTNSISNGNDPLYIIDGVPYMSASMSFIETSGNILGNPNPAAGQGASPLNSINPDDIESMEVLKDADATAIYGSRGSNGVILITTKRGQAGKTKVDIKVYSGVSNVSNKVDLLGRSQYLTLRKEALKNDNLVPSSANAPDLTVWDTTRVTDWQE